MPRYRPVVATLTLAWASRQRTVRAQLRARRSRSPRAARARRKDAGGRAASRHPRRSPRRTRRIQGSAPSYMGVGRASVPQRAGQALDTPRDRTARDPTQPRGGQPPAEQGRPPGRSARRSRRTRCATPTSHRCSPPGPTRNTSPTKSATRTSRRPTASTATCCSGAGAARSGAAGSWRCTSLPRTSGGRRTCRLARESPDLRAQQVSGALSTETPAAAMQDVRLRDHVAVLQRPRERCLRGRGHARDRRRSSSRRATAGRCCPSSNPGV